MLSLTLPALTASLACGLALAGADYFRKAVPLSVPTSTVLFYFLVVQLPLLGAWVIFGGAPVPALGDLGWAYWLPTLSDVTSSLIGNALFIVAVRVSPLTMVVPLLAFIPVLTLAVGAAMLGELPAARQVIGVGTAAVGVFVLYLPPGAGVRPLAMWRNFRAEPGAMPMIGVAVTWALAGPLDKMALTRAGAPLHSVIQIGLMALVVGVVLLIRRGVVRMSGRTWLTVTGAGLTAGTSYGLQLVAYSLTLVAFAESLKRVVEIGAALIVGALIFHEKLTGTKLIGIGLVAVGVPLMLFPG